MALEHRDNSSSWTYRLEEDSVETDKLIEKPILMATFPDGETEFKMRNFQLHQRVEECAQALEVLKNLNSGYYTSTELSGGKNRGKIVFDKDFKWEQFKDRLDIDKAALIGHSFGGATAVAAGAFNPEYKASVCLDGWFYPIERDLYEKIQQPILMLNASKWQWAKNVKRMKQMNANNSEKIMFTLKDIVHQSFSDLSFLTSGYLGRKNNLQGDLDPYYTGAAILQLTIAFLEQIFRGEKANDALQLIREKYAEFIIEGTDITNLDVEEE